MNPPLIIGDTYKGKLEEDGLAMLEFADIKEDKIRLKDPYSPWIFESNYATFSFYWEHLPTKNYETTEI